ncbi:hypothetical protein JTB14_007081 [Gonioctena quinquepunctata]|nr:hypothetical protein JTB14_007081 [Gonioctena quinquepunctata]
MAAKNKWTLTELEDLGSGDLFDMIDFIPSDGESSVSDSESDDEIISNSKEWELLDGDSDDRPTNDGAKLTWF